MNNKPKTAVEQFLNAIKDQISLSQEHLEMIESYAKQCKEIEKNQHEQLSASWAKSREQTREVSMHHGFASGFMSGLKCYEDYYSKLEETDLDEDEFTRNYIVDEFEQTYENKK